MQKIIESIKTNKIKCNKCGDIIESTHVHDCKKIYDFSNINYKAEKYREF